MPVPHSLLTLVCAAGLWFGGDPLARLVGPEAGNHARQNPLGICGSAYGSLVASLLRPSMDSYWHLGRSHQDEGSPHKFTRHSTSWAEALHELKAATQARNTPLPPSAGLQRYAASSADWRLQLALKLAPSEWGLLEIFFDQLKSRLKDGPEAGRELERRAVETIQNGSALEASLSQALAGAVAASHAVEIMTSAESHDLQKESKAKRFLADCHLCLSRYRQAVDQAQRAGWWQQIPEIRRHDMQENAALLDRLARSYQAKKLISN